MGESRCTTNAQYIAGELGQAIEHLTQALHYAMPYPDRHEEIRQLRDKAVAVRKGSDG